MTEEAKADEAACPHDEWRVAQPQRYTFNGTLGLVFECTRCGLSEDALMLMSRFDR